MPALIGRLAVKPCLGHFAFRNAGGDILGRKKTVGALPEHLGFGPTQHPPGALVPAGHVPLQVAADDGVVDRALDDLPVMAVRDEG